MSSPEGEQKYIDERQPSLFQEYTSAVNAPYYTGGQADPLNKVHAVHLENFPGVLIKVEIDREEGDIK